MVSLPGSQGLLLSEVCPAGLSSCLLKPQSPATGAGDTQVSYSMSGEHFDDLGECLQHHFMISVEVTVFLSALTGMLKEIHLLEFASVLSSCSLSNVFTCFLYLLSTQ